MRSPTHLFLEERIVAYDLAEEYSAHRTNRAPERTATRAKDITISLIRIISVRVNRS